MHMDELKALRLSHQHLLTPVDSLAVAADLCGLQAQFLSAGLHALRIRSADGSTEGLVKSWTLRGTVHLFPEKDLPLYIRRKGTPEDVCDSGWYQWTSGRGHALPPEREKYFARLITEAIASGVDTREALRLLCRERGMTEAEEPCLFNGWGGIIGELAQMGVICFKIQQEKAYRLCPDFTPLPEADAKLELARRYFTHFGPATLRDAAYFFRASQTEMKSWLKALPVASFDLEGRTYFHIPRDEAIPDIPDCLFLAGFDQLMLGYRKEDNPFLPPEHLRGIFNLAGIVMPAILLRGRVVGRWKMDKGKVTFTAFEALTHKDRKIILQKAESLWQEKKFIIPNS